MFAVLSHKKELSSLGETISKQNKAIFLEVNSTMGEFSVADWMTLFKSGLTSLVVFLLTLNNILPELSNSCVLNKQI